MTNFANVAALLAALLPGGAVVNAAAEPPAALVELESPLASPQPLQGYLRLPGGPGPSPAVVLLHGCSGNWRQLDERWGGRLAAWGYVTLTVDRFGPRGLSSTCTAGPPAAMLHDAYRALSFLTGQSPVDPARVAVMGFSQDAWLALFSVERGVIERSATEKFRAAIAFYPPCRGFKDDMTVPTLILVGEFDDWTPARECRNLVEGRDDWGISREKGKGIPIELIVYPGAYHGFDMPQYRTPARLLGRHLEFNQVAADQSVDAVRKFLYATIGGKEKSP
ncbi:MAG: dienelactone hydrolase family protein [Bradyrhizobium sp.]|uniref:dienelactone hydrolase family protein n=1 Tax=Bradyrhizobium sp. TaxID=376 RepID=UPI0025C5876C|nr:dienelactone hydrolase family protein [Bradyrhizobium sp.]MBI5264081.1 dienelactone hydrolase family protein [Bradyrhizobium sp.]